MTLAALIFDVDGTLAETEEAHREAFNRAFADTGLGWDWDRATYRHLLAVTGGKERMRAHADVTGAEIADDRIADLHRAKTRAYAGILAAGGLALRPGVAELVAAARAAGLPLALATTTSPDNIVALCRACWDAEPEALFDVIAAGDEVAAKKPAPDVYALALARLGLPPGSALAFEDSANGLAAARAAGLRVVVTPGLYTDHEDHGAADWLCPSLCTADLPAALRDLLPCPGA